MAGLFYRRLWISVGFMTAVIPIAAQVQQSPPSSQRES